jgi:CRISPR-associated endonuclease/helicase Cas3
VVQNGENKSPTTGDLRISRPPHDDRFQTVKDHLIETGAIAVRNLQTLGRIHPKIIPLAEIAGKWHDLGKLDPDWQKYIRGDADRRKSPGHAEHGAALAFAHQLYPVAFAIFGHHAGLHNLHGEDSLREKLKDSDRWKKIQLIAEEELGLDFLKKPDYQLDLAKDELLTRIIFSVLIDSDRESVALFLGQWQEPKRPSLEEISERFQKNYKKISQKDPTTEINIIRAEIFQACRASAELPPGFFRLSTPTGGGKTLSVMAFALDHAIKNQQDRIIYCPPYTSIIEQSADIYREAMGDDAVLEHHSGVVFDNQEELNNYEISAERWDYPIIVTTTVQLFESLFSNRPSQCRKVHRIANSVIILDEVQVLPLKYWNPIMGILEELVKEWNCSVVLCTATHPWYGLRAESLNLQDIIPKEQREKHFSALNQRVEYRYHSDLLGWEELAYDIQKQKLRNSLIVVSSKKDAREGFLAFHYLENTYHLSTNMYPEHRRQVIAEVRERLTKNLPTYLISTQLIEAGVDLDFDHGYRVITGLDSIIQTAGRVNRNNRLLSGNLMIFELKDASSPKFDEQRIIYTREILKAGSDIGSEKICQEYFKKLFISQNNQSNNSFDKETIEKIRQDYKFRKVAESFKMIEENKVDVIVPREFQSIELINKLENNSLGLNKQEWRKLYQYSVKVEENLIKNHTRTVSNFGVYIWKGNYDGNFGIST